MFSKINDIVSNAYLNVPFYGKNFESDKLLVTNYNDLCQIPIISKTDVNESLISKALNRNGLIKEQTSGSSGKYISIYKTSSERSSLDLLLWKRRRMHYKSVMAATLIRFKAAIDDIGGSSIPLEHPEKIGNTIFLPTFKIDVEMINEFYNMISDEKELWIWGPPSLIYLLALQVHHSFDIKTRKIKLIELNGEMVFEYQKRYIEEVFQCPVVNHYGSREFWGIAYECRYHNLHIFEESVFIEILDGYNKPQLSDKEGELVITGLLCSAMPFIRYKIGDTGKIVTSNCACGSCNRILELLGGRTSDYIIGNKGELSSSMVFAHIVSCINQSSIKILQFKVVQIDINDFVVYLVVTEEMESNNIEQTFFELAERLIHKEIKIKIRYTNFIKNDANGKFRYFIPMK